MKLIIAGSRSALIRNVQLPMIEIVCGLAEVKFEDITEIVCGEAKGADSMGKLFALDYGIPVKSFPPDYSLYPNKKLAPLARNSQMADYGDMLILIWDGESKGSQDMLQKMQALKKPVYVYEYDKDVNNVYDGPLSTQHIIDAFNKRKSEISVETSPTEYSEENPEPSGAKPPRKRSKKTQATEQTDLLNPVT